MWKMTFNSNINWELSQLKRFYLIFNRSSRHFCQYLDENPIEISVKLSENEKNMDLIEDRLKTKQNL